ncbi:class E sortase [Streptomyces sp. NPDC004267]|uniref:class E sortase n=1 Tax=Streptomyces sp. NPDC004267 TaxID=3364694 RepID=UPI003686F980
MTPGSPGSPWFRATPSPGPDGEPGPAQQPRPPQPPYEAEGPVYGPIPGQSGYGAPERPQAPQEASQAPYEHSAYGYETPQPYEPPYERSHEAPYEPSHAAPYAPAYEQPYEPAYETRAYETPDEPAYETRAYENPAYEDRPYETGAYKTPDEPEPEPEPESELDEPSARTAGPVSEPLPGPGRAERRRAARRKGRGAAGPAPAATAPAEQPARPLSRVEARRAARAAKDSFGVVLSRGVGELFITFGVVMLLFVTYQLWWTNVRAGQQSDEAKQQIENSFDQGGGQPGAFEPGKGFAIMYIPKLDVVVPIAEGTSKTEVLDKGMVGHYGEGSLKTAMPADKQGNFAVAGHRNTHGEPFRYINRLQPGDPIVVETRDAYYTYEMASILPQTPPSNVTVIAPVPKQSGFKGPGRYITLTTCTPEFTSTYRMIVWGKMVEERPRSKGKPAALTG